MPVGPGEASAKLGDTQLLKVIKHLPDAFVLSYTEPFAYTYDWSVVRVAPWIPIAHVVNPRVASSALASPVLSRASCPASQSASSCRPSSNVTLGWYPRTWRANVISAKQWRILPGGG